MDETADPDKSPRSQWWSKRSISAHVALVIWVPGCALAAWWQVGIALGGNSLGWVYSIMWPCFAVFGIVFWWFLVHDDPEAVGTRGLRNMQQASAETDDERRARSELLIELAEQEDPELAAYNAYLAELARADRTPIRPGRSRGRRNP